MPVKDSSARCAGTGLKARHVDRGTGGTVAGQSRRKCAGGLLAPCISGAMEIEGGVRNIGGRLTSITALKLTSIMGNGRKCFS